MHTRRDNSRFTFHALNTIPVVRSRKRKECRRRCSALRLRYGRRNRRLLFREHVGGGGDAEDPGDGSIQFPNVDGMGTGYFDTSGVLTCCVRICARAKCTRAAVEPVIIYDESRYYICPSRGTLAYMNS